MLKNIQIKFMEALFQKEMDLNFISSSQPSLRFNIYKNTIILNLINALSLTFPGIWKLLGKLCADNAACAFCSDRNNFPSSNYLDDWGGEFPEFLGKIAELKNLAYLESYANYEWLKAKSCIAQAALPIESNLLGEVPEDQIDSLKFTFLPSLFLFKANFPIDQIETIIDDPDEAGINLSQADVFAVIYRHNNEVVTLWIEAELWNFIKCLQQGSNLEEAVKMAAQDFDLIAAIHFLLEKQVILSISKNNCSK